MPSCRITPTPWFRRRPSHACSSCTCLLPATSTSTLWFHTYAWVVQCISVALFSGASVLLFFSLSVWWCFSARVATLPNHIDAKPWKETVSVWERHSLWCAWWASLWSYFSVSVSGSPCRLTFTRWECCGLCFWHKPTELAQSLLFCSCVCFHLYGAFSCISFHELSRQLFAFSLCSAGLISALLVLSTIYLFMKVSLSPDITLCGWVGLER